MWTPVADMTVFVTGFLLGGGCAAVGYVCGAVTTWWQLRRWHMAECRPSGDDDE